LARIPKRVALVIAAHGLGTALVTLGFVLIGRAALDGRVDAGWLAAWALALSAQVPISLFVDSLQAQIAIDTGALLKRRLLAGALALPT
jgi:ATP-binding cassette subfamily B protein